jgi:uncharacterized protein YjbI with pentapeptide repeats
VADGAELRLAESHDSEHVGTLTDSAHQIILPSLVRMIHYFSHMPIVTLENGKKYEISDDQIKEIEKTVEKKKFQIKNRWTGNVVFESEKTTWKEVIREAIDTGADLTGANLTGADLTDADLTDADLTGADLTGANLTGANLTRANLTDADLTGADLTMCLFYMGGYANENLEALVKAIRTVTKNGKKLEIPNE